MRANFKPTNPIEIEMTLSITMTVHDWEMLRQQLDKSKRPSYWLDNMIRGMVDKAKNYWDDLDGMAEAGDE